MNRFLQALTLLLGGVGAHNDSIPMVVVALALFALLRFARSRQTGETQDVIND